MLSGSALARVLLLIALAAGLIGFTRPYWAGDPVPQAVPAPIALATPSATAARRAEPQPAPRPPEPASVAAPASRPPPAAVNRSAAVEPSSLFEVAPAAGEVPVPAPSVQAAPSEAPATRQVAAADDSVVPRGLDLVDLNTGSLAALNALKGGGAVGRAIVQHRPYGAVDQLVSKRVLSRAIYQRVKDQVTVR